MTLYHGTDRADWAPHAGACFVGDASIAAQYGSIIHTVEVSGAAHNVAITAEMRDENNWPGDTAAELAAFAADGHAVICYDDETPNGRQHTCYRLTA